MSKPTMAIVVLAVLMAIAFHSERRGASAAESRGFADRQAVLLRFDQDTEQAVAALEYVLDKHDILAEAEAAILARSDEERIDAARRAARALRDAGLPDDAPELIAINRRLFGEPTVPLKDSERMSDDTTGAVSGTTTR